MLASRDLAPEGDRMRIRRPAISAMIGLVLLALGQAPGRADGVADFYRGKELRLIIGASVGGGYDIYARALAKHLGEHIPGNPSIVPQDMPAGGGLAAANHIYNVASRDGSAIGAIQNTVPFEPFFNNRQAQFDATQLNWLGTPTSETAMYLVWHASKIQSLQDARTKEMIAGGAGAASTPVFYGRVLNQILGLKARFVNGYPGQNEILLAMESGEVEAMTSAFWSSIRTARPDWIPQHQVRVPPPPRSASDGRSRHRPVCPLSASPRCAPPWWPRSRIRPSKPIACSSGWTAAIPKTAMRSRASSARPMGRRRTSASGSSISINWAKAPKIRNNGRSRNLLQGRRDDPLKIAHNFSAASGGVKGSFRASATARWVILPSCTLSPRRRCGSWPSARR
jgi:hypothetical protein